MTTALSSRSVAAARLPEGWLRPRQVLRLLALGLTHEQAAHQLGITRHTIKNHLTFVYEQLDVPTLVDALRVLGWLVVPDE
jgi:DNA-binding CsgD family transcriptional regulator